MKSTFPEPRTLVRGQQSVVYKINCPLSRGRGSENGLVKTLKLNCEHYKRYNRPNIKHFNMCRQKNSLACILRVISV